MSHECHPGDCSWLLLSFLSLPVFFFSCVSECLHVCRCMCVPEWLCTDTCSHGYVEVRGQDQLPSCLSLHLFFFFWTQSLPPSIRSSLIG